METEKPTRKYETKIEGFLLNIGSLISARLKWKVLRGPMDK